MFKKAVGLLALCCLVSSVHAQPPPEIHVDSLGDPLPPGAIARLGTTRMRHANPEEQFVSSLLVHADGKRVISTINRNAGQQGIYIWDLATGKQLPRLPECNSPCSFVAVSVDGKFLATDKLAVWNLETGKKIAKAREIYLDSKAVAFKGNNEIIAALRNGEVRWWKLTDDKPHRSWKCVKEFDQSHELKNYVDGIASAAFSPDGAVLVAHLGFDDGHRGVKYQDVLVAWEIQTGKVLWHRVEKDAPRRFVFSEDGTGIVFMSVSGRMTYRSAASGKELASLSTEAFARPLAISPNGKMAILGGRDFALWDPTGKNTLKHIALTGRHVSGFTTPAAAFSPDGRTIVAARDGHLQVFETATLKPRYRWEGHRGSVSHVSFSSGGHLVSGNRGDTHSPTSELLTWEIQRSKVIYRTDAAALEKKFALHSASANHSWGVAIKLNGVFLLDLASGTKLSEINVALKDRDSSLGTFSPLGNYFVTRAALTAGKRQLFEVKTGKEICTIVDSTTSGGVVWSPDEKQFAFQSVDQVIHMVDAELGKTLLHVGAPATRHSYSGYALQYSPDGKRLAKWVPKTNQVEIWDLSKRRIICTMVPPRREEDYVTDVLLCWSPDGRMLVEVGAADNTTIRVWETATGKRRHYFNGHVGEVTALAFSPDGRYLASGSADTTVLIWDLLAP